MMLPAIAMFGWFLFSRGMADTWTPSMAAAVAFWLLRQGVVRNQRAAAGVAAGRRKQHWALK